MLTFLIVLCVLLSVVVVGLLMRSWLLMPADRRRLEAIAADLMAEARIDAVTRSTLVAMRQAAQEGGRRSSNDVQWPSQ